jgi:hypothetical protein
MLYKANSLKNGQHLLHQWWLLQSFLGCSIGRVSSKRQKCRACGKIIVEPKELARIRKEGISHE